MPIRIRLTVFTAGGAPGTAAGVDVSVGAPAGTPLDAVLGALAAAVAPGSAVPGAVFCEDRRIDPRRALLGEPPLVDGAVLAFHRPLEETAPGPVPATLHVVAGPDAGGVHLLRGGEARIGRSARADVPLDDPDVSRAHCALTVGPDGSVTVTDTGSTNGTLLDGRPVTGGPVPVPHGGVLRLGESALRVLVPAGPASGAAPAPGAGAGPADAPDEPGTRRTGRRGLAGWARGRPAAAETAVREIPRFDGAAHDTAAAADEARCPDAAAVLLTALDRGPALWSRGPAHPDTLRVRLGTFHRPSRALPPSAVALTEAGSLGIAGPRERTLGVARSVLAQLAALHPPSTLELVVIAPGHEDDWSWLGWLPHVRPTRGQDCELLLAFDAEQAAARLQELTSPTGPPEPAGGRRTVVLADGDPGGAGARTALARLAAAGPQRGVHLITLADVPPATADSPAGRALAAARALSPVFAACGAAALLSGVVATSVRVTGPDGAAGPPAGVDAVSAAWAERFARALAPVTEESAGRAVPVPAAPGGTVPETCRLLDVLELARVTPGTLRERWTQRPSLTAVLGEGARGPVGVDLAALSGPLAIEGGTGAGRTELLVTLAASLATARSPRDLSLLLVEGTGEGLRPAAELPHVATWLGANDPLRMRAFAQALRAELKRRAALLGDADFTAARGRSGRVVGPRPAGDEALPEPEGPPILARGSDPLPWLVVLVDDFGELLAPALGAPGRQAAGSVVRILDAVVKEGRRLGVRLVTAGGPVPPGGGISVALTGQPAGRGELRRGGGGAGETFQAGRVTGRIPRTATLRPTVARVDWARAGDAPPRRPVRELGNGPTDMALLASAAARAAESDRSTAATLV